MGVLPQNCPQSANKGEYISISLIISHNIEENAGVVNGRTLYYVRFHISSVQK